MFKNILKILCLTALGATVFSFSSCSDTPERKYEQISQGEARRIMLSGVEYYLVDARTESEYAEGHIEGAVLIPEYEITERAEKELPDKERIVLVYCRSGRRSKIAAEALAELGYKNVKEFGGIIDWEYGTVK